MLKDIRLIIYDLDGVIIDSTDAICIAFNRAIEYVGEPCRPKEEIMRMIGVALGEMLIRVLPEEKHDKIAYCFDRYLEVYKEVFPFYTKVLYGVVETLQYFKEIGIIQTLATNKSSMEAERILGELGLNKYFYLILGSNSVKVPKPSPDMILLTLDKLDVKPENAVLVEDSPTGLTAGKATGVHMVAITTGTHIKDVFVPLEPEYILKDLRELMQIIATS